MVEDPARLDFTDGAEIFDCGDLLDADRHAIEPQQVIPAALTAYPASPAQLPYSAPFPEAPHPSKMPAD